MPYEREQQLLRMTENAFKDHVIRSRSQGRWRLRKRDHSEYWCEIVAMGGGGLCVWGDIDLVLFAYCSNSLPIAMVRWMGGTKSMDYVAEKANIGGGRNSSEEFDADAAVEDLEELLREYVIDKGENGEGIFAELFYDDEGNPLDEDEDDDDSEAEPAVLDATTEVAQFWFRLFREGTRKVSEGDEARARALSKMSPESFSVYWACREAIDNLIEERHEPCEDEDIDAFMAAIESAENGETEHAVFAELFKNSDVYEATYENRIGRQIPSRIYFAHAAVTRLNELLYEERMEHFYAGRHVCGHCNSAVVHHPVPNVYRCPVCHWEGPEDKTILPHEKPSKKF